MKILLVYAHPEPKSLNGSLKDFAVGHLQSKSHTVAVSDLYAMGWKAVFDASDTGLNPDEGFFDAMKDSERAYKTGSLTADVLEEQQKLRCADVVIFQFPLWWYTMPAIMKGWFDRVYSYGFAYGVGEHNDHHWGDRYGEGAMAGKRAMVIVTTGGWKPQYSARGINGPMDDLLFPIQHGMLFFQGFDVMPPFVVHRTGKVDYAVYEDLCGQLANRLDTIMSDEPIKFRKQNFGDYQIPELTLKAELAKGREGFSIHIDD